MEKHPILAGFERRADAIGKPLYAICKSAGIAPSKLYRWANGASPRLCTVEAIDKALSVEEAHV